MPTMITDTPVPATFILRRKAQVKTHEPVAPSRRQIQLWAGRISLLFFRSVICNSIKSQNVVHPAFYSIPALPLAWFNTAVVIYAACLLSAAPGCERIYLPGILKTDFTEPSASIGYWDSERFRLSTCLYRSHLPLCGWILRVQWSGIYKPLYPLDNIDWKVFGLQWCRITSRWTPGPKVSQLNIEL